MCHVFHKFVKKKKKICISEHYTFAKIIHVAG